MKITALRFRNLLQVTVPVSQIKALVDESGFRLVQLQWYTLLDDISRDLHATPVKLDSATGTGQCPEIWVNDN